MEQIRELKQRDEMICPRSQLVGARAAGAGVGTKAVWIKLMIDVELKNIKLDSKKKKKNKKENITKKF